MRTKILILCALVDSVVCNSQDPAVKNAVSGKITFVEKIKLEINLEGDAAQFADQLPKEQVNNKVLYFTPDYSLYRAGDSNKTDENMDMGGSDGGIKIRMINGGEGDLVFCDFKNRKKTEQKEFMTRKFLVEGDLIAPGWKMTGNFTTILGHSCMEAVNEDTVKKIKAWFTSDIPVSAGPAGFNGLPGIILQVDINDGSQTISATGIDTSPVNMSLLEKPKEGKKVTADEFKKIVDEKRKEMGEESGGGENHIVIKINR